MVGTGNAKAHQVLFLLSSTLPPPPFPYFLEQNLFFLREVGVDVFEANRRKIRQNIMLIAPAKTLGHEGSISLIAPAKTLGCEGSISPTRFY